MDRRRFAKAALAAALSAGSPRAAAATDLSRFETPELEAADFHVGPQRQFGRVLLLSPRSFDVPPRLLVLLHGLGETHDATIGSRAFVERYGLLQAYERLRHPPLARTFERADYFAPGRLVEINRALSIRAFGSLLLACVHTPNPYRDSSGRLLPDFIDFLTGPLIDVISVRVGPLPRERRLLAGVSLGGYVALETQLRRPAAFAGVCSVQGAFSPARAEAYARGFSAKSSAAQTTCVDLISSTDDPYLSAHRKLYERARQLALPTRLVVNPGPHNQPWLRESGTLELLLAADRALA